MWNLIIMYTKINCSFQCKQNKKLLFIISYMFFYAYFVEASLGFFCGHLTRQRIITGAPIYSFFKYNSNINGNEMQVCTLLVRSVQLSQEQLSLAAVHSAPPPLMAEKEESWGKKPIILHGLRIKCHDILTMYPSTQPKLPWISGWPRGN